MADTDVQQAEFTRHVRSALGNLYDPAALRKQALAKELGIDGASLRERLLEILEILKPAPEVAKSSRSWRAYELLQLRYVEALDPVQVQHKLGLTKSPYYVEHERAVGMVATLLADDIANRRAAADAVADGIPSANDRGSSARSSKMCHNLPLAVTSFVGREREMADVKRQLSEARLLTLTGAGGSGKSRLALEVARQLIGDYAGGIWLAELAPLTKPPEVARAVAEALAVPETAGRSTVESLIEVLRDREVLLIVDNCEHLLAASASIVYDLLRHCEKVRVLATSREALKLPGEIAWQVPTLSFSEDGSLEADAVRLFVERAKAASRMFDISSGSMSSVAAICRRLDGIPLAIELAAARVNVLSPPQIEQRLDDRFNLLTSGLRTALPRQQTLRAMVDWSYSLLSREEASVLRRLAVFAGGWDLDAAEVVCAGGEIQRAEVLDLLAQLVDKSLVVAAPLPEGEVRYRMLETFRQFGQEKLADAGEDSALHDRHAEYFLDLAEQADQALLSGSGIADWLNRLEKEHDNFRAALRHLAAAGAINSEAPGLRLVVALSRFWDLRDHWVEAREWLTLMLERHDAPTTSRARALAASAYIGFRLGAVGEAEAMASEAMELADSAKDKRAAIQSLICLSSVASFTGQLHRAVELSERADEMARGLGSVPAAQSAYRLGDVRLLQGRLDDAVQLLQRAVDLSRPCGGVYAAPSLSQLGLVLADQGKYRLAAQKIEEAVGLYEDLGNLGSRVLAQARLGFVMLRQCEPLKAADLVREGLADARQLGRRAGIALSLSALGAIQFANGSYEQAVTLLSAGEHLLDSLATGRPASKTTSVDAEVAELQRLLGEAAFTGLWAAGRDMPLQDVISLALTE